LVITNTVTIAGPGAGLLTIDGGGGASRIFEWRQTWYQSSQLWGVTATRGNTTDVGGAMLVISRLRVRDCRFVDNNADQGGAIFGAPGSVLTVIRSTLSGNQARVTGGAISASSVTLDSCEIRDNRANTGGGITSFGNLTIRQSTISGNTAGGGDGGGVYSPEGVVAKFVLTNCTVSGNVAVGAGGGIAVTIGSIQLDNSTVAYNVAKNGGGGGIRVGSSYGTFIRSSVVALNSAVIDPDASMLGANSTANSLFGTIPNSMNGWTFILPVGTNPRLGPLADNGGPTRTHALLPDSPCINLGANSQILATDQGGLPRVVGSAPDIGAFEVQPVRVAGVTVNDGSAQRSRVTSLTVNFTGAVSLPAVPGDAFRLVRQYDGAAVAVQAKLLGNSAVLTFTGGPLEAGSLADGKYTLTVRGSQVLKGLLDGNGDGMPGDDFVLVGNPATNHLYRMFGDSNGDGIVNQTDLLAFRLALFSTNPTFNADGNGQVDLADFLRFRRNLFRMVP
jgi:predicted outer membrane repeat protein